MVTGLAGNTAKLDAQCLVSAAKDQVSSELAGEVVILDIKAGVYHGLDGVGVTVWKLIEDRPRTIAELRDAIVAEYEVDPATCERDLLALVEQMAGHGLIEVRHEAGA